jgi:hypothetical protein
MSPVRVPSRVGIGWIDLYPNIRSKTDKAPNLNKSDLPALRPVDPSAIEDLRSVGTALLRLNEPDSFYRLIQNPGDPEAYEAVAAKVQLSMYLLHEIREWLRNQQPELLAEALPRWLCPSCGHPVDVAVEGRASCQLPC